MGRLLCVERRPSLPRQEFHGTMLNYSGRVPEARLSGKEPKEKKRYDDLSRNAL
jgi:hypothetical protein